MMLVYALLLIRELLNNYPELKEGNKMMTLHLVIFNLFLIDSIVYVFSVIFLYNRDTRSAEIACQVITDLKSVSYFAVFMFLAYLMVRFSNPPKEKVLPRLIALRQWHESGEKKDLLRLQRCSRQVFNENFEMSQQEKELFDQLIS